MAESAPASSVPASADQVATSSTAPATSSSTSAPVVVKVGVRRDARAGGTHARGGDGRGGGIQGRGGRGRGRSRLGSSGRGGKGSASADIGRGSGQAETGLVQGPILRHNKTTFAHGNYDPYYTQRNDRFAIVDPRIEELVRARGPGLFTGCAVLDLGCNSGFVTFLVAALGARSVVGVDIDVIHITRALKQLRNLKKAGQRTLLTASMEHCIYKEPGISEQFPSCFTRYSGTVPYIFKPLNPGVSATASALAEAAENAKVAAETVPEESEDTLSLFPHNLEFRTENVCISEIDEQRGHPFDVILCLKLTKWVHLQNGDEGLKVLLHRSFGLLRPGGVFVLEVQEWESYQDNRHLTAHTKRVRSTIRLKPEDLITYLVRVIGFQEPDVVGKGPSLKRPLLIFRKPGPPGNAMPAPPSPPVAKTPSPPAAKPPSPPAAKPPHSPAPPPASPRAAPAPAQVPFATAGVAPPATMLAQPVAPPLRATERIPSDPGFTSGSAMASVAPTVESIQTELIPESAATTTAAEAALVFAEEADFARVSASASTVTELSGEASEGRHEPAVQVSADIPSLPSGSALEPLVGTPVGPPDVLSESAARDMPDEELEAFEALEALEAKRRRIE